MANPKEGVVERPRITRLARRAGDAAVRKAPTAADWAQSQHSLRERIAKLIEERARSKVAFADSIGVVQSAPSDWLGKRNGKRPPKLEHLWKMAKVYGVSVDWLLGFDGVPMDRAERTRVGALKPALREEVVRELKERGTKARPGVLEAAVGGEHELWEGLVTICKERAEIGEQKTRRLWRWAIQQALQDATPEQAAAIHRELERQNFSLAE